MLRRIFDGLSNIGNYIAGIFLVIVMLLTMGEITGRYVFSHPIPGNFEIIELTVGVLATIGFAFALEQGKHIRATVLVDRFDEVAQRVLLLISYLAGFVVTGLLTWQLAIGAIRSVQIKEVTYGLLPVPMYPTRIILVFSVGLFCLGFLLRFIWDLRRQR
ncbi:MAG: TRAP transporter small permease [Chloroflexi bacterium]|nr:TRAP transporter small permease [Chloroflexota bacterium]